MNLCAEYNKGDGPPGDLGRMGVSGLGSRDGLNVRRPSLESVNSVSSRAAQRNLKEDCNSSEGSQLNGRNPTGLLNGQNGQVRHVFKRKYLVGCLKKAYKLCMMCVQAEDSGSGSIGRLELGYLEEERVRVLAKVDELKARITELEQQLQESKQEVNCTHKHTGMNHVLVLDSQNELCIRRNRANTLK